MEEKERFEEAKRLYKDANADQRYVLERIFPQLRESGDEKIRKAIINYFECQIRDEPTRKNILNKWINWLKFIKASSINNIDKSFIDDIKNIIYEAPGVLQADKNRLVAWLEKQGESKSIDIQSIEKRAHEVFPDDDDENTPLYRQAFIDGAVDYIDCGCKNIAWSEEDEKIRREIIRIVDIWTSSSPIVNGIPSETLLAWLEKQGEHASTWSEEDERNVKELLYLVEANYLNSEEPHDRLINFLESIRYKNTWKPSDEQMRELHNVFNDTSGGWEDSVIESLYNNLKKLRKEK